MYKLCIVISLMFLGSNALIAQDVQAENIPKETTQKVKQIAKPSSDHSDSHIYICQRCGTENQMQWNIDSSNENLELIPHCTFCGKKYWPKFKPSGFLLRSFCKVSDHTGSDIRL